MGVEGSNPLRGLQEEGEESPEERRWCMLISSLLRFISLHPLLSQTFLWFFRSGFSSKPAFCSLGSLLASIFRHFYGFPFWVFIQLDFSDILVSGFSSLIDFPFWVFFLIVFYFFHPLFVHSGVYTATIDSPNKVVVTGNVDADALIKKLIKSGKQAELWPEKKEKKSGKSGAKPDKGEKASENGEDEKKPEASETSASKTVEQPQTPKASGAQSKDPTKPENHPGGDPTPSSDNNSGEPEEKPAGGGGGKKKKKKKVQFGDSANNQPVGNCSSDENPAPAAATGGQKPVGSAPAAAAAASVHLSPPHQQHHYPYHYPNPSYAPQPTYGVSYSMAHPSTSHGAVYYSEPPPHYILQTEETHPPPTSDYDMFSDENPNGCSVM